LVVYLNASASPICFRLYQRAHVFKTLSFTCAVACCMKGLPQCQNHGLCVPPPTHHSPERPQQQQLQAASCKRRLEENMHKITAFLLATYAAFHATPKQSRKIVLRQVDIKEFGFLGVGRGSQRSFKLHGLQITWVPSWTDISFSRSPRWSKHSKNCRISFPT
jgi:hypothetical protein